MFEQICLKYRSTEPVDIALQFVVGIMNDLLGDVAAARASVQTLLGRLYEPSLRKQYEDVERCSQQFLLTLANNFDQPLPHSIRDQKRAGDQSVPEQKVKLQRQMRQ